MAVWRWQVERSRSVAGNRFSRAGIRAHVWAIAAAMVCVATGVLLAVVGTKPSRPSWQDARDAAPAPAARPASIEARPAPFPGMPGDGDAVLSPLEAPERPAPVAEVRTRRGPDAGAGTKIGSVNRSVPPGRSGELVSLEDEASREAERLEIDSPEVDAAVRALRRAPGEDAESFERRQDDERRRVRASEYLAQLTAWDSLRDHEFPEGFPAEERALEAARADVRRYEWNTEVKMERLRELLDRGAPKRPTVQYVPTPPSAPPARD